MTRHTEDQYKSPEQLERELDSMRSELDSTIQALRSRLSPGEVLDQALDYWRQGPKEYASEFGTNLSHSVRDNPLALGLVGVGLTWLMMGRSPAGQDRWTDDLDDAYYADIGVEMAEHRVESPGESGVAGEREDDGDGKWESAKHRAAAGARRAGDRASAVRDRARDRARRAGRGLSGSASRMGERGRRYRSQAGRQAARARGGAIDMFNEHPLVVGALGIAAGALIAAAIPPSRREDELMGEARDRFVDRARATAEQGADAAERAAHAAGVAARHEAEAQGLTPEAAEQAFHDAARKAGRVAQSAGEAAKEEVRHGNGTGEPSTYQHH